MDVSSDLLARGHTIRFRASGGSMRPAIADGDIVTVEPTASSNLALGSVAVYRRGDRVFAHRVVGIDVDRDGAPLLVCRGDAASTCDAPVSADQILGEVVMVQRGRSAPASRRVSAVLRRGLRAVAAPAARVGARLSRGTYLWVARRASCP